MPYVDVTIYAHTNASVELRTAGVRVIAVACATGDPLDWVDITFPRPPVPGNRGSDNAFYVDAVGWQQLPVRFAPNRATGR